MILYSSFYFFKDFIYLYLERGEGKGKEKEKNISVWLSLTRPLPGTRLATQACALTENQTSDPLVHRPALNPLSHTSQGCIAHFKLIIYFYLFTLLSKMRITFRLFIVIHFEEGQAGTCPPITFHLYYNLYGS